MVLKQWGQAVTIVFTPYPFNTSILVTACIWNRNSFPARLAGSPVQLSSVPKTAKETPALSKIFTKAFVILFALSSKLPIQPTQKRTSGCSPFAKNSAIVGTFNFSFTFLVLMVRKFKLKFKYQIQNGLWVCMVIRLLSY